MEGEADGAPKAKGVEDYQQLFDLNWDLAN